LLFRNETVREIKHSWLGKNVHGVNEVDKAGVWY
jgi:hypothetical protein